jgi:hypothetical protein
VDEIGICCGSAFFFEVKPMIAKIQVTKNQMKCSAAPKKRWSKGLLVLPLTAMAPLARAQNIAEHTKATTETPPMY